MKLNLNMFVFGVGSGNFLGFLINQRGINSNLEKIKELIYIYIYEGSLEIDRDIYIYIYKLPRLRRKFRD